uniref:Trypsin 27 n=1 Tax=Lygus lineolaris TaxID=50650 RepID=A0A286K5K0_LYGLI|nr:trypsin 27 [Lygus lineolaris]
MKSLMLISVLAALSLQADAIFKDTASNILSTLADKISQTSDNKSLLTCECGRPKSTTTRIINGVRTSLEGPFSSFVQVVNTSGCQYDRPENQVFWFYRHSSAHRHSSTLSQQHIVLKFSEPALHICAALWESLLGTPAGNPYYEYRTGKITKYTQKIDVTQVFMANYTGEGNRADDIAVLVLAKPLQFNRMVSRACLPRESEDLGGQQGRIAGWGGIIDDAVYLEDQITEGRVTILSAEKCNKYWQLIPAENPKQICVVSQRKTQQRANEGDSGAPVLWYDESIERYVAVGVVSYGLEDRTFNYPRVNTKVGEYLSFINSIVESTSSEQTCSKR